MMFSHPELRYLLTASSAVTTVNHATAIAIATEAGDIPQLQAIRSELQGLQQYVRSRGLGIDKENEVAEAILRDERGIGQVLIRMAENGERAQQGRNQHADAAASSLPTLMDLLDEPHPQRASARASAWTALARIPEVEFESRFGTIRDSSERISKVDFYRMGKVKPAPKPEAEREMHGDGFSSTYSVFSKAATALIAGIDQLPADELLALAGDIRSVVNAYNAERARR